MSKRRTIARVTGAQPSRKSFRGRRIDQPRTHKDDVRTLAAWVVDRTVASLSPSNVFLRSALERCEPLDHPLLRELSLGTLRWLRRLDHVIASASHRDFSKIEPRLRGPLRIGAYQLLFLDRVPPHAVVHEAVEHARRATHRGGASFTNAVLRRLAREPHLDAWPVEESDPVRRLAIEKSHPDFLVGRWIAQFGEERTKLLLDANNRQKPVHLLAFRERGGRELLAESLIDEGLEVEPSILSPLGLMVRSGNPFKTSAYRRGDFYIQDEASQVAALIPAPCPGESIYDAASSPGGKSFALASAEPSVRLLLGDVSPARLGIVRENQRRLGRSDPLLLADAGRPPLRGTFDRVVLDLPCSGTGTLRKNPELKWRIQPSEIGRLAKQARRLLDGSAPLVGSGGLLVAITCSLEPEENEAVVDAFAAAHPDFEPVDLASRLEWPLAESVFRPGGWRLPTGGDHDGFTVHVLRRSEGSKSGKMQTPGGIC